MVRLNFLGSNLSAAMYSNVAGKQMTTTAIVAKYQTRKSHTFEAIITFYFT